MSQETPPPVPRRGLRVGRVCLVLGAVLLGGVGGVFAYYYHTSRTVRDATHIVISGNWSPRRTFGREEVNLLLMGRDVDLDNRAQVVHTRGRTDLMMLAHLDFVHQRAYLLSVPRDSWVQVPGHGHHKINAAHALGGPDLAMATVQELLGVRPDYYLTVDYQAVARAIDQMGGVQVLVDKPLHYDDNWGRLHIHLEPGRRRLTGEQAVGMARYRKSNSGLGDTDQQRIARQQRLLGALRARLREPAVLLAVPAIVDQVRSNIDTNLQPEHLASLAWFARGMAPGALRMATLPGEQRSTCVKPDLAAARAMVQEMLAPPPTPPAGRGSPGGRRG